MLPAEQPKTWYHQVGHVINSTVTWKFICSEMLLSLLEQAACAVWLLEWKKRRKKAEILTSPSEIQWRWRKKLIN